MASVVDAYRLRAPTTRCGTGNPIDKLWVTPWRRAAEANSGYPVLSSLVIHQGHRHFIDFGNGLPGQIRDALERLVQVLNAQHDPAQLSKGGARVEEFSVHVGGPIAIGHASQPPTGLTGVQ